LYGPELVILINFIDIKQLAKNSACLQLIEQDFKFRD